jgi:hypothetical protein
MKRILSFVMSISIATSAFAVKHAITCQYHKNGRFGEHATSIIKALLLARKYGFTYVHNPIAHADQLCIQANGTPYTEALSKRYRKVHAFNEKLVINNLSSTMPTLFFVQYATKLEDLRDIAEITDEAFLADVRALFAPCIARTKPESVPGVITVALHVRRGGGYDPDSTIRNQALRFANDAYNVAQLKRVMDLFPHCKMLVRLFTDDPNPAAIVARYCTVLKNPAFEFVYRQQGNKHDANVVEDLLAMAECDCLIRPASCFSQLAQLIGNHKVIIYPTSYTRKGTMNVITEVAVVNRNEQQSKITTRYSVIC